MQDITCATYVQSELIDAPDHLNVIPNILKYKNSTCCFLVSTLLILAGRHLNMNAIVKNHYVLEWFRRALDDFVSTR